MNQLRNICFGDLAINHFEMSSIKAEESYNFGSMARKFELELNYRLTWDWDFDATRKVLMRKVLMRKALLLENTPRCIRPNLTT